MVEVSVSSRKRSLVKELEERYTFRADWEVRENANTNLSYSNFRSFLFDKLVKREEVLTDYLPSESVKAHMEGYLHIHKLPDSLWIPYCAGWSIEKLLKMGLKTPTIISKPAKHLDTAVSHVINFFLVVAQEWTGAVAMSALDLYLAPFVAHDSLNYREVKQALQKMLFELNYPARAGYQSPFTNITLVMDTSPDMLSSPAIVGGKPAGKLGDYVEEALTVDMALMELYSEGDALGQPFTFPIPTLMLTKDFDWNGRRWGELSDAIFETLANKGSAYLLNGYVADVEALYAMCCRLTIDTTKLTSNPLRLKLLNLNTREGEEVGEYLRKNRRAYGMWALPDATGSIGVVTLNLPRLAILSKGEWSTLEEMIMEGMELARKVLLKWRELYHKSLASGMMPLTKLYLGHLRNHFNTIGVIGLPEAVANFLRDPALWLEPEGRRINEAVRLMKRIVALIRRRAEEYEELDGYLYNVEEIPGESTAYRLASSDYKLFRREVEQGEVFIPRYGGVPFYSNSIVPYYANVPIFMRALWEGEVQQEFTGGVMMHLFLYERPDPRALKSLIRRLATNTKIVYFSITPTISVCKSCGWNSIGVFERCPKCGSDKVEMWSRIVGYYRPVSNWNVGKKAEFKSRVHYGGEEVLRRF